MGAYPKKRPVMQPQMRPTIEIVDFLPGNDPISSITASLARDSIGGCPIRESSALLLLSIKGEHVSIFKPAVAFVLYELYHSNRSYEYGFIRCWLFLGSAVLF